MTDDIKSEGSGPGGFSLSMVPILDGGSNWSDFYRRIEEYLIMSGLGSTMQPTQKPTCPDEPAAPDSSVRGEPRVEY
jgi:hypothetical protein